MAKICTSGVATPEEEGGRFEPPRRQDAEKGDGGEEEEEASARTQEKASKAVEKRSGESARLLSIAGLDQRSETKPVCDRGRDEGRTGACRSGARRGRPARSPCDGMPRTAASTNVGAVNQRTGFRSAPRTRPPPPRKTGRSPARARRGGGGLPRRRGTPPPTARRRNRRHRARERCRRRTRPREERRGAGSKETDEPQERESREERSPGARSAPPGRRERCREGPHERATPRPGMGAGRSRDGKIPYFECACATPTVDCFANVKRPSMNRPRVSETTSAPSEVFTAPPMNGNASTTARSATAPPVQAAGRFSRRGVSSSILAPATERTSRDKRRARPGSGSVMTAQGAGSAVTAVPVRSRTPGAKRRAPTQSAYSQASPSRTSCTTSPGPQRRATSPITSSTSACRWGRFRK